jgi:hypothetical protein
MGVTKMTVMLGFTLASFNLDRIRSLRAKQHLDEAGLPTVNPKQSRARRRTGTCRRHRVGRGAARLTE